MTTPYGVLRRWQLSTGLEVLHLQRTPGSPEGVFLSIRAGSRDEPAGTHGLAHALEHFVLVGTARWTEDELRNHIRKLGGTFNGRTSYDRTYFYAIAGPQTLPGLLDWIGQVAGRPRLDPARWPMVRKVVLREIEGGVPAFQRWANRVGLGDINREMLYETLWPGRGLDHSAGGTAEMLADIRLPDLKAFHLRHYRPDASRLVVISSSTSDEVRELVEERLLFWKGVDIPHASNPPNHTMLPEEVSIVQRGVHLRDVGTFWLGRATSGRSEDGAVLEVLARLVSNRLFKRLRSEAGLVYAVDAWHRAYDDFGDFGISTRGDRADLDEIEGITRAELADVASAVGEEEAQVAKLQAKGERALRRETTFGIGFELASLQEIGNFANDLVIDKVTPGQLSKGAEALITGPGRYRVVQTPILPASGAAALITAIVALLLGTMASVWRRRLRRHSAMGS